MDGGLVRVPGSHELAALGGDDPLDGNGLGGQLRADADGPGDPGRPVARNETRRGRRGTLGIEQGDRMPAEERTRVRHGTEHVVGGEEEQQLSAGAEWRDGVVRPVDELGVRAHRARRRVDQRRPIGWLESQRPQMTIDPSTPMTWPVT